MERAGSVYLFWLLLEYHYSFQVQSSSEPNPYNSWSVPMMSHDDFQKRLFVANQFEVTAKHMRLGGGMDHSN